MSEDDATGAERSRLAAENHRLRQRIEDLLTLVRIATPPPAGWDRPPEQTTGRARFTRDIAGLILLAEQGDHRMLAYLLDLAMIEARKLPP